MFRSYPLGPTNYVLPSYRVSICMIQLALALFEGIVNMVKTIVRNFQCKLLNYYPLLLNSYTHQCSQQLLEIIEDFHIWVHVYDKDLHKTFIDNCLYARDPIGLPDLHRSVQDK